MTKYSILFLSLGLLLGTSCEKLVETESPYLDQDAYFQNEAEVLASLNEGYRILAFGEVMGGNTWLASELMADNINGSNLSGDFKAYHTHNTGIFIGFTRGIWQQNFAAVGEINRLLAGKANANLPQALDDEVTGSALFVRAFVHFEMVRLFAQPYGYTSDNSHLGIPYRDAWSVDPQPRLTVDEVYTKIIDDLNTAIALLPEQSTISAAHANRWAAKALLAQVYFQMNNYTNAHSLAQEIVDMGPYALVDSIGDRFDEMMTTEDILVQPDGGGFNSGANWQGHYRNDNGTPTIRMSESVYAEATANTLDLRGQQWFTESGNNIFLNKANGSNDLFHPVLHLTEVLLIKAESAAILGLTAEAENDVNQIIVRAGMTPVSGLSSGDLISLIRSQRRLEMVGEGNRLHDLKRIAVSENQNLSINGAPWDCPGMVVQFPDDELNGNPGMPANEEGGC